MNILYSSTLCSNRLLKHLYETSKKKPTYAEQKFHRLLAKGFVDNGCSVDTITSIPCSRDMFGQYLFYEHNEKEEDIRYNYALTINIPFVKNIAVFLSTFFYSTVWCLRHRRGTVICDVLNVSVCIGAFVAAKICGNHLCAIVTDIPGLMVDEKNNGRSGLTTHAMMSYINSFDSYVLLTEQMNERVNLNHKPYIVMEGLVDSEMAVEARKPIRNPRIVIYAGGLYEQYGVKMLVDAFDNLSTDYPDCQLHLYGDGTLVAYIKGMAEKNQSIIFHGAVQNAEVVEAELKATLLVNPRPTHEDFTKYSFPSKNMEYMVSGTPVLTTRLPGMPQEYYPYVYLFDIESSKGYETTLRMILARSEEELDDIGRKGQKFVLETKNNQFQSLRVLKLMFSDGL